MGAGTSPWRASRGNRWPYDRRALRAIAGAGRAFRRLRRLTIATRARSASFTVRESGNSSATSGSRSTTLVPSAYLAAYFPRTPPRKSYSARTSGSRTVVLTFLIRLPHVPGPRRSTRGDHRRSSEPLRTTPHASSPRSLAAAPATRFSSDRARARGGSALSWPTPTTAAERG